MLSHKIDRQSRNPAVSAGIAGAFFFPVILYILRYITSGMSVIPIVLSAIVSGNDAVINAIVHTSAPPICMRSLSVIPVIMPISAWIIAAPPVPGVFVAA